MNDSGTRSLTALYVVAPFSMGYVDFYTATVAARAYPDSASAGDS